MMPDPSPRTLDAPASPMVTAPMEKVSAVETSCTRADCDGWQGTVTYSQQGEHAGVWTLPVREQCAALEVLLTSGGVEDQPCPLAGSAQEVDG